MPKRILALAMFIAAFAAVSLVVTVADESDSSAVGDFGVGEAPFGDFAPKDPGFKPMGNDMRRELPVDDRFDKREFGDFGPMEGPKGPMMDMQSKAPEYNHDATPDDFERLIPVMVDEDISAFDPEFVEDAIEYAKDNGMQDAADMLQKKLADYISVARASSLFNAMDTRASGFDDEETDDSDPITVEDEEEDEDPMPYFSLGDNICSFLLKPVSSASQVNLQLDL